MQLLEIEASNFRAYEKLHLSTVPSGLTLVTGPNNAGKCSLLTALDVAALWDSEASYGRYGANPSLRVRFSLSEGERISLLTGRSNVDPDPGVAVAAGDLEWVEWQFDQVEKKLIPFQIISPLKGKVRVLALLVREGSQYAVHAAPPIAGWDGNTLQANVGLDLEAAVLAMSKPGRISSLGGLLRCYLRWQRGYFHFDPLRRSRAREVPLASHTALERDGQNLAEVLLHLQHNDPEAWTRLGEHLEGIVPDVGQLMTPTSQGMFHVAFRDKMNGVKFLHNLKDVGTGVEQVLLTLVAGMSSSAQTIVLEEPETGLHPAAQRALLSVIQDWARRGRTFFISTHSPVFLDWASSNVIEVRRENGASEARPVSSNREEVLRALGVRLSDAMSAERLLVVEGKSDELILQKWFPRLISDPAVAIIRGEGGDSARHVDILAKWLEQADRVGLRKILYIRDRDELPRRLLKKLEGQESAFLLPCREIENLLLDFAVLPSHLAKLGAKNVPSSSELEGRTRMVADSLRQVVVMKRTAWDLEPLRFVDNKSRDRMARAGTEKEGMIEEVISRIPKPEAYAEFIRDRWDDNEQQVASCWDRDWRVLAPGFELLNHVYKEYLNRSFDKVVDGPILAGDVPPPAELVEIVEKFVR
ncbi:AAA family ATPase [Streptomyces sp. A244]|uniref:AAA family ATPase n=1 Tax=Streptomyces sp. A244 TaxID=2137016 RepID=UPI0015E6B91D|nr:AAA family ATPase [Streptomyces sp. A244]